MREKAGLLRRRIVTVTAVALLFGGVVIAWLCVRPVVNRDSAFGVFVPAPTSRDERIEREVSKARRVARRELPLMGSSDPLYGSTFPRWALMPAELRKAFGRSEWTDEEVDVLVGLLARRITVARPPGEDKRFDELQRAATIMSAGQRLIVEGLTNAQSARLSEALLDVSQSDDVMDRLEFQAAVFRNGLWSWPGWLEAVKNMRCDMDFERTQIMKYLERFKRRRLID